MKKILRLYSGLSEKNRTEWFIFFLTGFLGAIFFSVIPGGLKSYTGYDYETQVLSLIQGHGFISPEGSFLDRYPPAIPLVLAGLHYLSGLLPIGFINLYVVYTILVLASANVLLYRIALLFNARSIGVLAALLFATCPFIHFQLLRILSEPTFIVLFYAALYILLREFVRPGKWSQAFILTGVLIGLCMLTRPVALFYPLIVAGFILLAFRYPIGKKIAACGIVLMGSFFTILPWEYAIYQNKREVITLSSGDVSSMRDGLSFNNKTWRTPIWLPTDVEKLTQKFYADYDSYDSKKKIVSFMAESFKESPVTVVKLYVIKAARAWYGTDSQQRILELFNAALMFVYFIFFIAGVFFSFKRGRRQYLPIAILLLVFILYSWATTAVVLSILRYMAPVLGLIFIFAAIALDKILRYFKSKSAWLNSNVSPL